MKFIISALLIFSVAFVFGGEIWKSNISQSAKGTPVAGFDSSLVRTDIDGKAAVSISARRELLTIQNYIGAARFGDFTLEFPVRFGSENSSFLISLAEKKRDAKEGFSHYELTFTPSKIIIRTVFPEGQKAAAKALEHEVSFPVAKWIDLKISIKDGNVDIVSNSGKSLVKFPVKDSGSFRIINATSENAFGDIRITEDKSNIPATLKKDRSK